MQAASVQEECKHTSKQEASTKEVVQAHTYTICFALAITYFFLLKIKRHPNARRTTYKLAHATLLLETLMLAAEDCHCNDTK